MSGIVMGMYMRFGLLSYVVNDGIEYVHVRWEQLWAQRDAGDRFITAKCGSGNRQAIVDHLSRSPNGSLTLCGYSLFLGFWASISFKVRRPMAGTKVWVSKAESVPYSARQA